MKHIKIVIMLCSIFLSMLNNAKNKSVARCITGFADTTSLFYDEIPARGVEKSSGGVGGYASPTQLA